MQPPTLAPTLLHSSSINNLLPQSSSSQLRLFSHSRCISSPAPDETSIMERVFGRDRRDPYEPDFGQEHFLKDLREAPADEEDALPELPSRLKEDLVHSSENVIGDRRTHVHPEPERLQLPDIPQDRLDDCLRDRVGWTAGVLDAWSGVGPVPTGRPWKVCWMRTPVVAVATAMISAWAVSHGIVYGVDVDILG